MGTNASALSSAMSSVAAAYSSMKDVISSDVSQAFQDLLKQESMTEQSLNCVQKALVSSSELGGKENDVQCGWT